MRKTVYFLPIKSNINKIIESCSQMSFSERNCIWYHRSELDAIRTNAKLICRSTIRKRKLSSIPDINNYIKFIETTNLSTQDSNNDTRGLELATDVERKQRKHYANKIIVTAQKSMKANELCTLSLNLSS